MDVIEKAVVFYYPGKEKDGWYFYNAANDSQSGKIFGVVNLTLPKAVKLMQANGIDPLNDFKMIMSCYCQSK